MNKDVFDYTKERAEILTQSGSSKQETKDAAQAWLDAVSAASEDAAIDEATATFLDYLEGRPNPIEGTIAFAAGPAADLMGKETADAMLAAATAHKDNGGKYCICEACTAASEILAKNGRIEL